MCGVDDSDGTIVWLLDGNIVRGFGAIVKNFWNPYGRWNPHGA
jgi:hypothetical protein